MLRHAGGHYSGLGFADRHYVTELCQRLFSSTATDADEYTELCDAKVRRVLGLHAPLRTSRRWCGQHDNRSLSEEACKLTFDLLTLKLVSESRVTRATSVPILVFLGLSVLDLGPMYAIDIGPKSRTDRQTSDVHHSLMPLP